MVVAPHTTGAASWGNSEGSRKYYTTKTPVLLAPKFFRRTFTSRFSFSRLSIFYISHSGTCLFLLPRLQHAGLGAINLCERLLDDEVPIVEQHTHR